MTDPKRGAARNGPQALSAAVSAVLSVASGSAAAQEAQAPAPEVAGLDEVIVTATKRAERLQDVSESISAFGTEAIALRGLQQIDDVAKYIPGLSLAQREPAGTTIVFRGVASSGIEFGGISSSALYLDEQPITQSGRNPDPRFIDIERVEALRGPQGTLYGASSQSGTLRVITNKPDPSGFDAWAEAQASHTKDGEVGYDVSAMVNLPLASDRLALRLVGFSSRDAGYIDNVLSDSLGGTFDNAAHVEKDVNEVETNGGRAALRLDITDDVDVTLGLVFQDVHADGHGDVTPGVGDLRQVRFEDESLDDKWYQAALTLNASMPFADLVLAASYFDRKFAYEADATDYEFGFNLSATYYGAVNYDWGGDPRGFATNHERTFISNVEARLQSNHDAESRWSWLAGAFYSRETGHTEFDSFVRGYADTPAFAYFNYYEQRLTGNTLPGTDRWFLGVYDPELEQRALFGEVGFDVTENFKITAGGRWFEYDRRFQQHQEAPEGFSGDSLLNADEKSDEDGTVWKANFSYKFDDDHMVYATYSEGFRVGGSNPLKPASILPRIYTSDTLKNYEIGAKTEWLDNRLRVNVAAYTMDWDGFSVQIEDPQNGGFDDDGVEISDVFQLGYVNLPSARIQGVESEISFVVSDAWQIDASLGWNDAEVSQAVVLELTDDLGRVFGVPVQKGARLPLTPDWQASLGFEWRPRGQLLNAQPFARLDLAYVGEVVTSLEGIQSVVGAGGVESLDAYETGDLRFGLEGERWTASLFVDNVWDERAVQFLGKRWGDLSAPDFAHTTQRLTINRPRTIGLQFRYEF
jgi:outer membrane receptor protein involved in Fe transport